MRLASSSSGRESFTDGRDSFPPALPILHGSGQVFWSAARILTQLLYVCCARSAYTGMPMFGCPEKHISDYYGKEQILAKPRFVKQTQPIEDGPLRCSMSVNYYRLTLLLGVYSLLCRASEDKYTVSVPENANPGTDVVSLLEIGKAELPCVIVEGDPYGRFYVSTDCTVVVFKPLDWSVQSDYLLKIRVGQLEDTSHRTRVVSVLIIVTNIPGYPPVYNETCETPSSGECTD
ncbi:Endothelial cell-specific molecule 1 [Branchiostoma belcheri]|nr:Endothelial cell-specific molecule 1 [Branchiostoma belcheri]